MRVLAIIPVNISHHSLNIHGTIIITHGLHIYDLYYKNARMGFGIAYSVKAEKDLGVERFWSVCTEPKEVSELAGRIAQCKVIVFSMVCWIKVSVPRW